MKKEINNSKQKTLTETMLGTLRLRRGWREVNNYYTHLEYDYLKAMQNGNGEYHD
jgi:hypothetical protein